MNAQAGALIEAAEMLERIAASDDEEFTGDPAGRIRLGVTIAAALVRARADVEAGKTASPEFNA